MAVTRRIDDPGVAERDAAGDLAYRAAVAVLEPLVPASATGRWCVLRERTDWLPDDPDRFSVYGPYGRRRVVDVGATLIADAIHAGKAGSLVVRVVAWHGDQGLP